LSEFIIERSFFASLHSLSAADHSATFYIINTSQNRNGWAVTEKSLKEALPTLKKASLGIGPDYQFDQHYKAALAVGKFLSYNQPDPSYALATAAVSDERVWGMMQRGELGPVSVVLHSYRESCSKCGATLPTKENPAEHTCIKEGSGHEQLDSFVFHRVDFIEVPAYPQAGLLEFCAKSADHSVPLEVLASFYVSQSPKLQKEPKIVSEKIEEKISALEQANKQLEADLKSAQEEAKKANTTTQELTAKLEAIAKEKHQSLVEQAYEARVKAGVAGKEEQEKEWFSKLDNETLLLLIGDAEKIAIRQAQEPQTPKTKYNQNEGETLLTAVNSRRTQLGLSPLKELT
jgi:hypothetical protein